MDSTLHIPQNWKRNFASVWASQSVVLLGDRLVQFALVWWLVSTTGSAAVLASASMVVMVPQILVGPIAGALIDRRNRKIIMIAADALMLVASGAMAWVIWAGHMQIWHIYVVMFVRSLAEGFSMNALSASTSLLVPGEHLSRVAGLNQMLQGGMQILAPTLGALALTVMPLYGVMTTNIALVAVAIVLLLASRVPQPVCRTIISGAQGGASLLRDVADGFRFVWRWQAMFLIMVMSGMLNFFVTPTFTLLPLFVTKVLGGNAVLLGTLESGMGIGIVVGGLSLGAWGGFKRRIMTSLVGVGGMGVGILILANAPASAVWVAVTGMFLSGFMNPLASGPLFAVIQATVPPDIQGRVGAVLGSLNQIASPLGLLLIVPVADLIGVRGCFMISGIAFVLMSFVMRMVPAIMHVEDNAQQSVQAALGPRVARKASFAEATSEERRIA